MIAANVVHWVRTRKMCYGKGKREKFHIRIDQEKNEFSNDGIMKSKPQCNDALMNQLSWILFCDKRTRYSLL